MIDQHPRGHIHLEVRRGADQRAGHDLVDSAMQSGPVLFPFAGGLAQKRAEMLQHVSVRHYADDSAFLDHQQVVELVHLEELFRAA